MDFDEKRGKSRKFYLELLKKMISYASNEGDLVLDPFIGSGQTIWAAKALNRKYLGFEKSENYYEFAKERISRNQYKIKV